MSNATGIEWLEENSYRAYPLTSASNGNLLLSSGALDLKPMLLDANFTYSSSMPDHVMLERVQRTGNSVSFTVTSLPVFTVDLSTATYPCYCFNASNDVLVLSSAIGSLHDPADYTLSNVELEPTTATELAGEYLGVASVSFNGASISSGDITFTEGYQVGIVVNGQTIQVEAGRNYGLSLPCQDFFNDGNLASDCTGIVSFINGATPLKSGGTVRINAGQNLKIFEDPELNRLYVGLDFTAAESCNGVELPPVPTTII
jgi:hypothetical protein